MKKENLFFLNIFQRQKRYLLFLLFFLGLSIVISIFFLGMDKEKTKIEDNLVSSEEKPVLIPEIFSKSLNLNPLSIEPSFFDLSSEMQVWIYDVRPDDEEASSYLEIMLGRERQSKIIPSGDKVYLNYDNGYVFSETPTSFWIIPSSDSSRIIKVKIEAVYFDINNEKKRKKEYFELIAAQQDLKELEEFSDNAFMSLKEANCLEPDLLLEIYGKDIEKEDSKKNRLIFPSDVLYIQENDILILKDGVWKFPEDDTKNFPLAWIRSISNRSIEIDVWFNDKKKKHSITLFKNPPSTYRASDDFITDLNVRTHRQISCKIGKQRFILREKDLLVKKKERWKKVKFSNLKDGDEYFVFDNIDTTYSSKIFRGYLFNKDRTQVIKIEKNISNKILREKRR